MTSAAPTPVETLESALFALFRLASDQWLDLVLRQGRQRHVFVSFHRHPRHRNGRRSTCPPLSATLIVPQPDRSTGTHGGCVDLAQACFSSFRVGPTMGMAGLIRKMRPGEDP